MGPSEKQRKYNRLKHPFMTKFRIYQQEGPKEARGWDMVTIRNVSAGGLSFNYNKKIPVGTVLELNIGLTLDSGSVRCLSVVCRVDEGPLDKKEVRKIPIYGVAVRFKEMDDTKREAIKKLVQQFHSKGA